MKKETQNLNLYFKSEEDAIKALKREARVLKRIARQVWEEYQDSYKPVHYVRTGDTLKSIQIGKVKQLGMNEYGIEITYENDLVYHDSIFGGKQGHTIMLIGGWKQTKMGWQVKTGWHKNVKRLGYWEGFDYIGTVQERYNDQKNKAISLEVKWSGKALR